MMGPEQSDEGLVIHETRVSGEETGNNANEPPWEDKAIWTGTYGKNPWRSE